MKRGQPQRRFIHNQTVSPALRTTDDHNGVAPGAHAMASTTGAVDEALHPGLDDNGWPPIRNVIKRKTVIRRANNR
jgi:hypothetical protein